MTDGIVNRVSVLAAGILDYPGHPATGLADLAELFDVIAGFKVLAK